MSLPPAKCIWLLLVLLVALPSGCFGYYHFVHYPSASPPFPRAIEKFDLGSLIDGTVYFYVSRGRTAIGGERQLCGSRQPGAAGTVGVEFRADLRATGGLRRNQRGPFRHGRSGRRNTVCRITPGGDRVGRSRHPCGTARRLRSDCSVPGDPLQRSSEWRTPEAEFLRAIL